MSELLSYLDTIQPELMNVTRLFGLSDELWAEPHFLWEAQERDGQYVCRFQSAGQTAEGAVDIPPDEEDARLQHLHRKRAARRLMKQTLYDLCRTVTGVHPPWGSLTGIRPTHLMYEALDSGMSIQEASTHLQRQFDVTEEKARLLCDIVRVQRTLPAPVILLGCALMFIGIIFSQLPHPKDFHRRKDESTE